MIILITIPLFDIHFPGRWSWMYPGVASRDYAQYLQVANGIIPQQMRSDWQTWQQASVIQYLNTNNPQRSMVEGDNIASVPTGATGTILTDDGVTLTFIETGGSWVGKTSFTDGTITANINNYVPGAAVLSANAQLLGSGALPQHVWITDAAGTDLGAIMFCPNSYTVGLSGLGGFLNPDFQNVGDYRGVAGFGVQKGMWYPNLKIDLGLSIGDVVIWGNSHCVSITGDIGSSTDQFNLDSTNWSQLSKTAGNGYIEEWDIIGYDFANDLLRYRVDRRGNEQWRPTRIDPVPFFQWGNDSVINNNMKGGDGIRCLNQRGAVAGNSTLNGAVADIDNTNVGTIANNFLTSGSEGESDWLISKNAGNLFKENIITANFGVTVDPTIDEIGLRCQSGFSNFGVSLSVSSSAIDVTGMEYCGIINIAGSGSLTLNTINGLTFVGSGIQFFRIKPAAGVTLTFNSGTATNITLLGSSGGIIVVILKGANGDYCDFWSDGITAFQNAPANNF